MSRRIRACTYDRTREIRNGHDSATPALASTIQLGNHGGDHMGVTMNSSTTMSECKARAQLHLAGSASLLANLDLSMSRVALIRAAAYVRSASRGFIPGHELEDWLAAEEQVDQYLAHQIPVGFYG